MGQNLEVWPLGYDHTQTDTKDSYDEEFLAIAPHTTLACPISLEPSTFSKKFLWCAPRKMKQNHSGNTPKNILRADSEFPALVLWNLFGTPSSKYKAQNMNRDMAESVNRPFSWIIFGHTSPDSCLVSGELGFLTYLWCAPFKVRGFCLQSSSTVVLRLPPMRLVTFIFWARPPPPMEQTKLVMNSNSVLRAPLTDVSGWFNLLS